MALDVSISRELSLIFTTPLYVRQLPAAEALNAGLKRLILAWRDGDRGKVVSNVGGWQSPHTLLDRTEPEIKEFRLHVDGAVRALLGLPAVVDGRPAAAFAAPSYGAFAWANVNGDGAYNQLHAHPRNHWAVVYYVDTGTPASAPAHNGRIELRDPRPAAVHGRVDGFTFGQPLAIEPKPGLMIGFPAWIEHWVHPFRGAGERISIAVNVNMTVG